MRGEGKIGTERKEFRRGRAREEGKKRERKKRVGANKKEAIAVSGREATGCVFFFFFFKREGKGERKGKKHQCERETLIGCLSHVPQPATELTSQASALTGNQTSDLSLCGTTSNYQNSSGQGTTG